MVRVHPSYYPSNVVQQGALALGSGIFTVMSFLWIALVDFLVREAEVGNDPCCHLDDVTLGFCWLVCLFYVRKT